MCLPALGRFPLLLRKRSAGNAEVQTAPAPAAVDASTEASAPPVPPELLRCGICLDTLILPATLPCGHSFCRHSCLAPWLREKTACPECRAPCPTALPKTNLALSAVSRLARGVSGAAAAEEEAVARTAEEAELEAFLASGARALLEAALRGVLADGGQHALADVEARVRHMHPPPLPATVGVPFLDVLRRLPAVVSICACTPPHVSWVGPHSGGGGGGGAYGEYGGEYWGGEEGDDDDESDGDFEDDYADEEWG